MADHTSFKVGGPAELWIRPEGECFPEFAAFLLDSAQKEGIPVFILGGGANLVVSDDGIKGIVLDTTGYAGEMNNYPQPPFHNFCFRAGTLADDAAENAAARGFSGLEFLAGMPGSMGGALWMNARCYEQEMADVIREVQILEEGKALTFIPKKEEFGYKKSPFQKKNCLIMMVSVALQKKDTVLIRKEMEVNRKDREAKGHYRFPCAGSVFKNNRAFGGPTGKIIDDLGLKGLTAGDAQLAPWHGNIIINRGKARAADILALVETIERRVKTELGIDLEREIIFM
jgi:UDP-N-acetylmuramate dehydrogenase